MGLWLWSWKHARDRDFLSLWSSEVQEKNLIGKAFLLWWHLVPGDLYAGRDDYSANSPHVRGANCIQLKCLWPDDFFNSHLNVTFVVYRIKTVLRTGIKPFLGNFCSPGLPPLCFWSTSKGHSALEEFLLCAIYSRDSTDESNSSLVLSVPHHCAGGFRFLKLIMNAR